MNNLDKIHGAINDKDLYNQKYFDGYYLKDDKRDAMYKQERARILKYYPTGGIILDVGCGVGGFLAGFDDRWQKYATEPSEFASEKASRKGISVMPHINTLEMESMDVVVFRGTLQHINFPMEALVQATRVLRRGGLLVILQTPDTDSLVYNLFHRLPALDAPRNWMLFGHSYLNNILVRLGYIKIKNEFPYLDTPYARPVQDFIKFVISLFFGWRKFAFPGNMFEVFAIKK